VEPLLESDIRVIQYLGSKLRILDEIENEIKEIIPSGGVVCDLFSGSGVVSYKLANRYTVYANDVQAYAELIAGVLLCCNKGEESVTKRYKDIIETDYYRYNKGKLVEIFGQALTLEKRVLDNEDYEGLAELCNLNLYYDGSELTECKKEAAKAVFGEALKFFDRATITALKEQRQYAALFSLYYLNSYFSLEQCVEIDSVRYALDKMHDMEEISDYEYRGLLVCLIHAVSEIVSTVGKNFAQPIKVTDENGDIKNFAIKRCMRDRKLPLADFFDSMSDKLENVAVLSEGNKSYCMDAMELLEKAEMSGVDVFYLDPPYTIDHYSRFYHVLETLVKYDYPNLERKKYRGHMHIMNGRYRENRFQSNYCIPSRGYGEFEKVIERIHATGAAVVLSYSEDDSDKDTRKRVVTRDELIGILQKYYNKVEVRNLEHRYRKLSAKESNRKEMDNSELLIICRQQADG
jgi:adenine-specific DNA methylase